MILHILNAELAGPASLFAAFSDGCDATVDLRPLLSGVRSGLLLSTFFSLLSMAWMPSPRMDTNGTRINVARAFQPEICSVPTMRLTRSREGKRKRTGSEVTAARTHTRALPCPARPVATSQLGNEHRTRGLPSAARLNAEHRTLRGPSRLRGFA